MRLIRGKFDSAWKFDAQGILRHGYFETPLHYARRMRGGLAVIEHLRQQPWTGWHARGKALASA